MLDVTKAALEQMAQRLARKGTANEAALRFKRREGGWTLCLDRESPGDTAFRHAGRTVLVLAADVAQAMADMTLDARETGPRSRLKLCRNEPRGG